MKLEWNNLNFPLNISTDYFWESGLIINFDTLEARAKELKIVDLYKEINSYKDEFIVVGIKKDNNLPKHRACCFITLLKIKDGVVSGEPFSIGYPTKVSNSAKWLRLVDHYVFKFEKDSDEEIIYEHEVAKR